MRRTATAVATAAALLSTLSACGDAGAEAEPKASASTTYKLNPRDQFLQAVNAAGFESWAETRPSQDELLAFPERWCTELKAGHSVEWLLGDGGLYPIGDNWGTEKPEAQEAVVLGVEAYCPKLKDQVTEELRETGAY